MFLRLTNARLILSENRQTHTYTTSIHIYRSKQGDSKEYYQRDLGSEKPRDNAKMLESKSMSLLSYFDVYCII